MKIQFLKLLKPALIAVPFLMFSCSEDADAPIDAEPKLGVVEEQFVVNAAFEDVDLLTTRHLTKQRIGTSN